jgi:hypothetical protein
VILHCELRRGPGPAHPRVDDRGVERWLDTDGQVAAYGGSVGGRYWMVLPNVGSFSFDDAGETVDAYAGETVSAETVDDAFRRIVLPMAIQVRGRQVLHASGVAGADGVVALCAVSETGKSTLAYGLASHGFTVWADDAVAFEPNGAGVTALPLPFALRLRPQSAEYFGAHPGGEVVVPASAPLAAVCVLERGTGGNDAEPVAIERVEQADAFALVLAHAYSFTLEDEEKKAALVQAYLNLVARVPVLRVRLREGLDQLPRILDALASALAPAR